MVKRNVFVNKNKENIIKDYKAGLTLYEIVKKYNIFYSVVKNDLREWGIKKPFRKLSIRKRYDWSFDYPCCKICCTTKHKHSTNGICHKCIQRKNKNVILKICPVCGEKYVQIFRHGGQEIIKKKNKEHTKYLKDLLEKRFNSNLGLDKIADDLQTDRHTITKWFSYFFGKQATKERNEKVRCFLISSKAVENFPFGPQVKHPKYTDRFGREFKFRSQLEHTFAKWLDRNKMVWEYEIKTFSYNALDGKIRHYTPDFYFPEFDFYVELKGRKFDGTEYKIEQTEKENNIKIYTLWQKEILCSKVLQEAL